MFNHANARLPRALDGVLRWIVVTPDMHRIHHSLDAREQFSNFGFNLTWWDRLLRTYRAGPSGDPDTFPIGVTDIRGTDALRLDRLLVQPMLGRPSPTVPADTNNRVT
jgi:sterol desaturase/sphingolipid hydroxylase (fatty acid hydroxylase superfamily)